MLEKVRTLLEWADGLPGKMLVDWSGVDTPYTVMTTKAAAVLKSRGLVMCYRCVTDSQTTKYRATHGRFHEKKVAVLLDFVQITPTPPIWKTCTTFLERQKRRFKRHSE